jgi:hypothetical protein
MQKRLDSTRDRVLVITVEIKQPTSLFGITVNDDDVQNALSCRQSVSAKKHDHK